MEISSNSITISRLLRVLYFLLKCMHVIGLHMKKEAIQEAIQESFQCQTSYQEYYTKQELFHYSFIVTLEISNYTTDQNSLWGQIFRSIFSKDLNLLCFIFYLMSTYESKFRKDMAELLKIGMKLYEIDEQYTEVRMFLRQFAVIPNHLKHLLVK